MSPFASWCLLGALITVVFLTLWLLSGEPHDGEDAEDRNWLEDE